MRRVPWLLMLCAGCQSILGLDDIHPATDAPPITALCVPTAFTGQPTTVLQAEDFALPEDRSFALLESSGLLTEHDSLTAQEQAVDLGPYVTVFPALSPEGDLAFTTQYMGDTPVIVGARRLGVGRWQIAGPVPPGARAGAPSATRFGPRRVFTTDILGNFLQEYELGASGWTAIGSPYDASLAGSAFTWMNLSPDALTLIFTTVGSGGPSGVSYVTRPTRDARFVVIPNQNSDALLAGAYTSPHVTDDCSQLYVTRYAPGGSVHDIVRFDH